MLEYVLNPRVLDTRTGETFTIDPQAARVRRLQRRISAWGDAFQQYVLQHRNQTRLVFITLTYAPTEDRASGWRKNHIRDYIKRVRYNLADNLLAYAWVAELQQRGEVHYHIMLLVNRGTDIPRPDESWWPHGSSNIQTARRWYYIMKYCSKGRFRADDGEWKSYPKGMRIFAVWVSGSLTEALERFRFNLSAVPRWLEMLLDERGVIVTIKRAKGGGWNITGDVGETEKIPSPYHVLSLYELVT